MFDIVYYSTDLAIVCMVGDFDGGKFTTDQRISPGAHRGRGYIFFSSCYSSLSSSHPFQPIVVLSCFFFIPSQWRLLAMFHHTICLTLTHICAKVILVTGPFTKSSTSIFLTLT